jgi:hypothetical protein
VFLWAVGSVSDLYLVGGRSDPHQMDDVCSIGPGLLRHTILSLTEEKEK